MNNSIPKENTINFCIASQTPNQIFISFLQTSYSTSYGYAYSNGGRRSQGSRGGSGSQDSPISALESKQDTRLKNLIRETRLAINNTRSFWTQLPYELCRAPIGSNTQQLTGRSRSAGQRSRYGRGGDSSEGHCWNGRATGRYTNAIVSDGLVHQDRNPEVRVDIHRPDVDINDQIVAIKLITKKMESAHQGQDVKWPTSTSDCEYRITSNNSRPLIIPAPLFAFS